MYHIFIHSSVVGHLGCFYVLAIVNSGTMNTRVDVAFRSMAFLWIDAQEWDYFAVYLKLIQHGKSTMVQ